MKLFNLTAKAIKLPVWVLCVSFFSISFNTVAQTQLKHWYDLPYDIDVTGATPTYTTIPGAPTEQQVGNGMYDPNGKLLFYVSDDRVYDRTGNLMGFLYNVATPPVEIGTDEIANVPSPVNLNCTTRQYFIFYNLTEPGPGFGLWYVIVDMNLNNGFGGIPNYDAAHHYGATQIVSNTDDLGAIAIGKYNNFNDGKQYGYYMAGGRGGSGVLYMFTINSSGVVSGATAIAGAYSKGDMVTEQLVLSPDGTKLGWGSWTAPAAGQYNFNVLDLVTSGPNTGQWNGTATYFNAGTATTTAQSFARGACFDATSTYLVGGSGGLNRTDGIYYANITGSGATTATLVSNSDIYGYGNSQIDLAYDGYFYAVSQNNNGSGQLGIEGFTPNNMIPSTAINIPTIGSDLSDVASGPFGEPAFYTLPDQIDGYDYDSQYASDQCCINSTLWDVQTNGTYSGQPAFIAAATTATWTATSNPFNNSLGGIINVGNNIEIPSGANVTINNMTFNFSPDAGLIIDADAKVTLNNGAILTSYNNCGSMDMWQGVTLNGNGTNQLSGTDGRMFIYNNSKVENALTGVTVNDGGYLIGSNSSFINNINDVVFTPFIGQHDYSRFSNTFFITNKSPLNNGSDAQVHVTMTEDNGITFGGCTFENTTILPSPCFCSRPSRGTGILSWSCPYFSVYGSSKFSGLTYGVYASSSNNLYTTSISGNTFTLNQRGIFLQNMDYDAVNSNTFTVFSYDNTVSSYIDAWGLYMTYCHGFHVEGNDFSGSSIIFTPINTYGIVVDNSNPKATCGWADNIYRNSFHYLMIGCQAQGSNDESRNYTNCPSYSPGADGLVFGCNNYFNNISTTDFAVAGNSTVSSYQGNALPPSVNEPYPYGPANNIFNQSGSFAYVEMNNAALPSTGDFTYFYNPNSPPYQPTSGEYTSSTILPLYTTTTNSCPSELNLIICIPCIIANINASESEIPVLGGKIDGGNTAGLLNDIQTESPGQIYNALLAASPYLSDPVLSSAIMANLPAGTLKDIILANSSVSPYIMSLLNNANLPPGIRNDINSAQTGTSQMEILQSQIAGNMQNIGSSINALIYHYLQDTSLTFTQRMDSALYIIKVYGVNTGEQLCQMTAAYAALNDTADMDSTIAAQTGYGPLDNFCKILQIFNSLQNGATGTAGLVNDTNTLTTVQGVATDTTASINGTYDNGTAGAQALLDEVFRLPKYAIYVEPLNNQAVDLERSAHNNTNQNATVNDFHLYPNPNNGSFQMTYSLNSVATASLELYNDMGSKVKTYTLDPNSTMLKINVPNLPAGVYLYRVMVNGQMQSMGKVVIMK